MLWVFRYQWILAPRYVYYSLDTPGSSNLSFFPIDLHRPLIAPKTWKLNSLLLRFDAAAPILHGIVRTMAHWKALDQSFLLSRRSCDSEQGWLRGSQAWIHPTHMHQNLGCYDLMQRRRSCTESCERWLIGKLSIRAFFWAVVRVILWRIGAARSNLRSHELSMRGGRGSTGKKERNKILIIVDIIVVTKILGFCIQLQFLKEKDFVSGPSVPTYRNVLYS